MQNVDNVIKFNNSNVSSTSSLRKNIWPAAIFLVRRLEIHLETYTWSHTGKQIKHMTV